MVLGLFFGGPLFKAGELDVSDSVGPGLDIHQGFSAERGDITRPDPY